MLRNRTGLIIAGLAALGYYKYSKMTPEQKNKLIEKGKDLFNKNLGGLENIFGKKPAPASQNGSNP